MSLKYEEIIQSSNLKKQNKAEQQQQPTKTQNKTKQKHGLCSSRGRSSLYWAKFNFTIVCGWPPTVG